MQTFQTGRPSGGAAGEDGRRERAGMGTPSSAADLTCRVLTAVVRQRLAARGFDWGDALRTGARSTPAGREEER